jgi:hypothetical protein
MQELMSRHPGRSGAFEIRPLDEELTERCQVSHDQPTTDDDGSKFVCVAFGRRSQLDPLPPAEQSAAGVVPGLRQRFE